MFIEPTTRMVLTRGSIILSLPARTSAIPERAPAITWSALLSLKPAPVAPITTQARAFLLPPLTSPQQAQPILLRAQPAVLVLERAPPQVAQVPGQVQPAAAVQVPARWLAQAQP